MPIGIKSGGGRDENGHSWEAPQIPWNNRQVLHNHINCNFCVYVNQDNNLPILWRFQHIRLLAARDLLQLQLFVPDPIYFCHPEFLSDLALRVIHWE
jgi:hypothetical protein